MARQNGLGFPIIFRTPAKGSVQDLSLNQGLSDLILLQILGYEAHPP